MGRNVFGPPNIRRLNVCLLQLLSRFAWNSGLRRLKTYLRSTIRQDRLNAMIMATAHVDLLDNIDVLSVARNFTEVNDARRKMYGSFTNSKWHPE